MSLRDFRCPVTGVSLLGSEAALVFFLDGASEDSQPLTLPLWGRYLGQGTLEDVQDGPNADMILAAFQQALADGTATIAFGEMGLPPQDVDHIETLIALVACAQIHQVPAVRWGGQALRFTLLQAHVAAALMEEEPEELDVDIAVDGVPAAVVGSAGPAAAIYAPLRQASHRLRCKFGLSFIGLQALKEAFLERDLDWRASDVSFGEDERQAEKWLAEALLSCADHAGLVEALSEYSSPEKSEL